ncbi:DNA replication protein, partial [Neisseria gonorrhoeae]
MRGGSDMALRNASDFLGAYGGGVRVER